MPKNEKQIIQYKSFTTLGVHALNNDLQNVELLRSDINHENCNIDTIYDKFKPDIMSIFDKHAPIKQTYLREKQLTLYE